MANNNIILYNKQHITCEYVNKCIYIYIHAHVINYNIWKVVLDKKTMQFVTVWHTILVKPKFETSKSKEPHHEAAGTAQRFF